MDSKSKLPPTEKRRTRLWKQEETAQLIALWPSSVSAEEIGQKIGRTVSEVRTKAAKLHLRRSLPYRFSKRPEDLAYLSGLIDGDGAIGAHRHGPRGGLRYYSIRITVTNTSLLMTKWLQGKFAGSVRKVARSQLGKRQGYIWEFPRHHPTVVALLWSIRGYLTTKKHAATLALRFTESRIHAGHGGKAPLADQEIKALEELKRLNNRAPEEQEQTAKTAMVAGGWDPFHVGHLRHIKMAALLADRLVVVTHNYEMMKKKNGYAFQPVEERVELMKSLRYVDEVVVAEDYGDDDGTVTKTLEALRPDIYAKGGDRTPDNTPASQIEACRRLGIEYVFGLGNKVQSSERLVGHAAVALLRGWYIPRLMPLDRKLAEVVANDLEGQIPQMGVS